MRIETTHGELRFAPTPKEEGSHVVGVVGYVPNVGTPLPLLPVRVSSDDHLEYAIANVMADAQERLEGASILFAASRTDVAETTAAITEWMRGDHERRGHRSPYATFWLTLDDEEVGNSVRTTLASALDGDAFRTARDFCQSMQIDGNTDLLKLVEPACERVKEVALEELVESEAAGRIHLGFTHKRELTAAGEAWVEAVSSPEPVRSR